MVKTPNLGHPLNLYLRYKDFTHEIGFTEMSLRQVLLISGFSEVEIKPWQTVYVDTHHLNYLFRLGVNKLAQWFITKFYHIQGFVSPTILSPLILGVAKKVDSDL